MRISAEHRIAARRSADSEHRPLHLDRGVGRLRQHALVVGEARLEQLADQLQLAGVEHDLLVADVDRQRVLAALGQGPAERVQRPQRHDDLELGLGVDVLVADRQAAAVGRDHAHAAGGRRRSARR
jgi:hypothetical protein